MRALFVSAQFPDDLTTSVYGVYQRMRMWLDALRGNAAELDLLFYVPSGGDVSEARRAAFARGLAEEWGVEAEVFLCGEEAAAPTRTNFDLYVRPLRGLRTHPDYQQLAGVGQRAALTACLARAPKIVLFFRLASAVPLLDLALDGTDAFLDIDDVEHKKFAREVGQPPYWRSKPALYLQLPGLWLGERRVITRMRSAFVCSDIDKKYLRRTMWLRNVEVMPNAVQRVVDGPRTGEQNVMFIGAYSYAPNVIAAEYLIREIWPRLRALKPEAQLLIAGSRPQVIPSFSAPPPGVRFMGFMEDLDALYTQVRVMCCPIRSGGGTRIKILEAAGYGVPVVSTTIGAEGLTFVEEDEILLRDEPQEIASACARLLDDEALAVQIGKAARQRVRAEYGRDAIVQRMGRMLFGAQLPQGRGQQG